jgi:hypothetical protein
MTMPHGTAAPLGADARAFVLLKSGRRPPSVIDLRTFCTTNMIHIIVIMEQFQYVTKTIS